MKAILKAKPAPGAVLSELPDPKPRHGELLIQVHRASICGSDLALYNWNSWAPGRVKTPLMFGHEFCGTVLSCGPGADGFKAGDFVSVESHIYCDRCLQCRLGQRHVCADMKLTGVDAPGGFGEFAVIPARVAWRHRTGALRDMGSLFEPFGNAVYSVSVEDVKDQIVLVLGAGPQGLFAIAVAKALGARRVVVVEGSKFRGSLAEKMGADAVVKPDGAGTLAKALKAAKRPEGYDVVLELSGNPEAAAMSLKAVRAGGRITAFGLPGRPVEVDWAHDLIFKGLRVYGIIGRRIWETWEQADALLESGAVDLRPVVTHVLPLRDFKEGFRLMMSPEKNCGKVVLVP